jgi:POT family proton-dependent oligopeptide transporter
LFELLLSSEAIEQEHPPIDTLLLSMATIVTGVGFLKANISTVVGALYEVNDQRRDAGFTLFYMGANIGGALGPIMCGWVGARYGWRYGFGLAGVGMLIAIVTYLWGQRYLEGRDEPEDPAVLERLVILGIKFEWLIYISAGGVIGVLWYAFHFYQYVAGLLIWFAALLGMLILYISLFRCSSQDRDRMLVVLVLIIFSVLFWSLYMQMFSSLSLFADRLVDRTILGHTIATPALLGLPAIFVIILAPLFSWLWIKLASRHANPSIPVKFSIGLVVIGIGFLVPELYRWASGENKDIHLFAFAMIFFLMVCGELCQAPIAMNMVTKLCPRRVVGMMMGSYFVSLATGSIVAGKMAKYTSAETVGGQLIDALAALDVYVSVFATFGLSAIAVGFLLYALSPLLHRYMHIHEETHGNKVKDVNAAA